MQYSLALVTGASSGIGQALCEILASKNIALIITGRDLVKLEETAANLRHQVEVQIIQADLSIPKERQTIVEIIRMRGPDLIVNNAGLALYNDAVNFTTEQQLAILEVDGMALLEFTLEGAKAMKAARKKGTIMNISSAASFFVFPYFSVYAATKSFVNKVSQSLDYELQKEGIRVLVACPGMVDTNFRVRSGGKPVESAKGLMTSKYAAEEIWKQITLLKPLHIFDWKYRLAVRARFFIPQWISIKILINNIKNRCQ